MAREPDPSPVQRPAGLWRRLAALAYDGLIQLGLFFCATALLLPLTGGQALPPGNPWYSFYLLAVSFGYNSWCWIRGGQTVGMRAWRLRIVDQHGAPPTWRQATVRYFAALAGAGLLGLGFWWIALNPGRRAWHDRLSGTRIVDQPASQP